MRQGKITRNWLIVASLCLTAWFGLAANCLAGSGDEAPFSQRIDLALITTAPADAKQPEVDTGNNAWVLISSALVLMMTGPGLALFYCGLVRKKNVLSVMMHCVFLMGMMSVVWALWGYSFAFGGMNQTPPTKWFGNLDHLCLKGIQPVWENGKSITPIYQGDTSLRISALSHMLFQGMFFIITPALICGAFAERMKFSTMVVFTLLWGTLIYCPLAHWVWGNGPLAFGSPNATGIFQGGALDFAGGTVVHISSGVSALICALLIGKRLGFGSEPMPPHNMTYTAIGATMLWVGWFGFNAGSALKADGLAATAFAVTHLGAAAGALSWACVEWIARGKPTLLGACSGAVAGLVCVTPASGFVLPIHGIVLGLAVGVVCYFSCTVLKSKFGYDDSLDAFGVHGVGGTLGALLTGVFATRATGATDGKLPLGLLEGGGVWKGQIVAVLVTWAVAIVGTFVILKVLDVVMGLRVTKNDEIQGLDYSEHGEEGYIFI